MLTWLKAPSLSANLSPTNELPTEDSRLGRRLFYALGAIALVYAFLAGLSTAADPDLPWQLATGRFIAQHHSIFSTDVFSYTRTGVPWMYPAGSGLILYWVYLLGGYSLISWLGAAACLATMALLLRRGSAVTAALGILAVPFIAFRAVPRAELFAIVLFAAFVSLLWQNFRTSRAPLWLLPLLMVLWVNVHLGFFSGLALLAAFAGMDILELPFGEARRTAAMARLKREIPWFALTAVATLLNPWGWKFFPALLEHTRILHTLQINEWTNLHWNWTSSLASFTLRSTNDLFHVLLLFIFLAIAAAFWRGMLGPAILLMATTYQLIQHVRMVAPAGCVVVVVGGSMLFGATMDLRARIASPRTRLVLATSTAAIFAAIAIVRTADLVTNYHYLAERNLSTFGVGLSPWFPRRAADFVQQQKLPGEVMNTFNEGGFVIWALGPERRDYMDGRAIPFGPDFAAHGAELLSAPLDSELWQKEAAQYNINTILFPLTLDELSLDRLKSDCASKQWRPVYLDEVSVVLVRRKPETEDLLKRFEVDCAIAPLPREPLPLNAASFNSWIDAARVLSALGRNAEALATTDKAMAIFPDNAHARWYRGQILYAMGRDSEAEQDWQRSLALGPREVTPWASLPDFQASVWASLAELYSRQERMADAIEALQNVLRLSSDSSTRLQAMTNLGTLEFQMGQNAAAEQHWLAAVALAPKESTIWFSLADLYQKDGRTLEAIHALQQAIPLTTDPATKAHAQVKLARLYFMSRQPKDALQALDDAARVAPPDLLAQSAGRSFSFDLAQGRAAAWMALGDLKQATAFEEKAVKLDPDAPDAWTHLARLYQREGRVADQQRAEERGRTLLTGGTTAN